ncbi:unnamed protein product [Coregonus sp. 'balchen']|nr:unnamed protein product [Coregonus sp. 'balchen']
MLVSAETWTEVSGLDPAMVIHVGTNSSSRRASDGRTDGRTPRRLYPYPRHPPHLPAVQMHPDNKLTNHGKQVSSDSQSQLSNVTQQQEGANKGLGAGSQSVMKTKRERSVSVDSGEQRDALEPDAKVEGVMRSKRRCVLEKKQPYSGDEWCSGPDTEEEEDKPQPATHCE